MKHHINVRWIVLLALCFAMTVFATSCNFKDFMASMPWAKDKAPAGTSEPAADEEDGPSTPIKDETPVPTVEHKGEMSDDDFIKGSWGDTSER